MRSVLAFCCSLATMQELQDDDELELEPPDLIASGLLKLADDGGTTPALAGCCSCGPRLSENPQEIVPRSPDKLLALLVADGSRERASIAHSCVQNSGGREPGAGAGGT